MSQQTTMWLDPHSRDLLIRNAPLYLAANRPCTNWITSLAFIFAASHGCSALALRAASINWARNLFRPVFSIEPLASEQHLLSIRSRSLFRPICCAPSTCRQFCFQRPRAQSAHYHASLRCALSFREKLQRMTSAEKVARFTS